MKKTLVLLLTATTMIASAQEMIVNRNDGTVLDKLSIPELHQATNFTDDNGQGMLKVELRNGAAYSSNIDDITVVDITTKDDMLTRGKFANMKRLKEFNSVQELAEGDLIGIFNEADYDYDGFMGTAYYILDGSSSSLTTLSPETRESLRKIMNASFKTQLAAVAAKTGIRQAQLRYHIADIVYVSKDIDGTKIPLSARLVYPYSTTSSRLPIDRLYVEQHTTLFEENMEPTSRFYPFSCAGMVFHGYMVAQPDLLGFGVSNMRSQLFVHRDINSTACVNLVKATKEYVKLSKKNADCIPANLTSDAMIISAGSSQGGSTALGFTYQMENGLSSAEAAALPKVVETRLCAGAFNLKASFEEFAKCDSLHGFLVPVVYSTAVTGCPDYMRYDDGSQIMPYDMLHPSLKTMTWEGMEDKGIPSNMTIWQMLNSRKAGMTAFSDMFKADFAYEPNPLYTSFRKITADGMMKMNADGTYSLNYDDPRIIALMKYMEDNNLTDNNLWVPKSDITLLHTVNDAIVPFVNSKLLYENMAEHMRTNGYIFSFNAHENPSNLGHVTVCLAWMLSQVTGLPENTVLSLFSSK